MRSARETATVSRRGRGPGKSNERHDAQSTDQSLQHRFHLSVSGYELRLLWRWARAPIKKPEQF
jgi:hypothetical protein